MAPTTTSCSCPGKVLMVGGYAVLDRPNPGLVVAVSARFETSVRDDELLPPTRVVVESPQWGGWVGEFQWRNNEQLVMTSTQSNKYVEQSLAWAMAAAAHVCGKDKPLLHKHGVRFMLLADNDFYSQQETLRARGLPLTRTGGLAQLEPNSRVSGGDKVSKTGLGSSAAMITSLTAAVLKHFCGTTMNVETIHRVAQICHAAVQGKIGSGFDVCAAIYGSVSFVRYDPSVLTAVMQPQPASELGKVIMTSVTNDEGWNHIATPSRLPRGMEILCGDIAGGSETPSMSRAILNWKNSAVREEWNELLHSNAQVLDRLSELTRWADSDVNAYDAEFAQLARLPSKQWSVNSPFTKAALAFAACRKCLKQIGKLAQVPVEPAEQTDRCDKVLSEIPGVLAAGVPGAGGYDAVFALVLGKDVRTRVEQFWETTGVLPLMLRESSAGEGLVCTTQVANGETKRIRMVVDNKE